MQTESKKLKVVPKYMHDAYLEQSICQIYQKFKRLGVG